MQLENISPRETCRILSEAVYKRSYFIPHIIHELPLTSADLSILITLFKIEDDFLCGGTQCGRRFIAGMGLLVRLAKRSESTIKRVRRRLKYMQIIDYSLGVWKNKKATEYRILIDSFYRADKALMGANEQENKDNSN